MLSIITEKTKKVLISSKFRNLIFILFIIFLSVGLFEALILSPQDYLQSDSVRIMYVHVPSAWISLGIFSIIAFLSLGVIIFKNKNFVLISKSLAPSGFIFNLIALVTGSIWGKPTWGTWWAWDPRITSMLVLFLFYFLYLLSWKLFEKNKAIKISSYIDKRISHFIGKDGRNFIDWTKKFNVLYIRLTPFLKVGCSSNFTLVP